MVAKQQYTQTHNHKFSRRASPSSPMKRIISVLIFFIILAHQVCAQSTAFSYQGHLNDGGNPANGAYDVRFAIFDAPSNSNILAGPITNLSTTVAAGVFSATLDFGAGIFSGPNRWLDISVRTNGAAGFVALSPRQAILAVPYSVLSYSASNLLGTLPTAQLTGNLPASQLSGVLNLAQLPAAVLTTNASGVTMSGAFTGNGSGLTGINTLTNSDNATFIAMAKALEAGNTFTNWGRFSWRHTLDAICARQSFQVLRVGDGLADSGMLMRASRDNLMNQFALAGFMGNSKHLWDPSASGSATIVSSQTGLWYKRWGLINDQNGVISFGYEGYLYPDGLAANVGAVFYVAEPGAGHFSIQTNINNGPWMPVAGYANVDANYTTAVGRIAAWTNSTAELTKIRVVGNDSGKSVKILDAALFNDTASSGFIINDWVPDYGPGSASIQQILTTNLAVTAPIFAWWNPQLILFQKIGIDYTLQDALFDFFRTNTPNSDLVLCGIYPYANPVEQSTADHSWLTNAMAYGFAFFDGRGPFGDATQMQNRGWILPDTVHGTLPGYAAYDGILSYWLGLDTFIRGNNITGSFSGNGSGLTNVPADAISGGLTLNIPVALPGGGTNLLCFTNGTLRAIKGDQSAPLRVAH
jgi:hypothetical protein